MADEIELKLDIAPAQLARLKGATWLARYASGPAEDRKLVSVYYDTDDLALQDKRVTLRVRDAGGAFVQTFKGDGGSGAGLSRLEWERPVDGPKPQLRHARKKKTGGIDLKKLRRSLKPVFETVVQRHVMPLRYRGDELELAIDQGHIKTGRRRLPIHEAEVELKCGKAASVIGLGREIAGKLKASYGVASKAERGYALRADKTGMPASADDLALSGKMNAGEAFRAIAMSCVHHFAGNKDAVIAGEPEGIHQMRVGLRRLRAAISLFKEMLRGAETKKIKDNVKWLTEQLGPARDMHVLADEGIPSMVQSSLVPEAVKVLKTDVIDKRDDGVKRANRAVASARYRRLVLEVVLWINGGRWTKTNVALIADRRALPASRFAAQELGRRTSKALKKIEKLKDLSPLQRHKLRIAIKKLRYAVGYFESLFADKKKAIRRFSAVVKELQSALGQLNDIRVHGALAKSYAKPVRGKRRAALRAFAFGELTGKEEAMSRDFLKAAKRGGKRLERSPRFWT